SVRSSPVRKTPKGRSGGGNWAIRAAEGHDPPKVNSRCGCSDWRAYFGASVSLGSSQAVLNPAFCHAASASPAGGVTGTMGFSPPLSGGLGPGATSRGEVGPGAGLHPKHRTIRATPREARRHRFILILRPTASASEFPATLTDAGKPCNGLA